MQYSEPTDGMSSSGKFVKRLFDITASILGLILLSPFFIIIYAILKCQEGGHAFYSQERIGYRGMSFNIYKFRTMQPCNECDGIPLLTAGDGGTDITPFCRFLREHHLDELPQLWNVLKGDMSFVGPRPERQYFINMILEVRPDYVYIYKMRPGLTSMATLYNGYTDSLEKMLIRLDMDLDYLKKRTVAQDAKIILTTFIYLLTGKKF